MNWKTLKALRALRDDKRAPQPERDAAAEMLRRKLAAAGIHESDIDADRPEVCQFLVGRRQHRRLFIHIASWMLRTSPLPCHIAKGADIDTFYLLCTKAQSIDITDCYGHYAAILSVTLRDLAAEKRASRETTRKAIRKAKAHEREELSQIKEIEAQVLNSLINKYQLFDAERDQGRPLSPKELAAALAAQCAVKGDAWSRKISGDPKPALGNGDFHLEYT